MECFHSVWLGFFGAKGSLTSGAGTAWRDGNGYSPGLTNIGFHQVSQIHWRQKSGDEHAKLQQASPRLGVKAGFAAYIGRTFPGSVPSRFASTGRTRLPSVTPKCDVPERRSRWATLTEIPA